jgi:formylglycine-generating enzyme required for sulfatase activity
LAGRRTDFGSLARLARDYDFPWEQIPNLLEPEFLERVNGEVFASAPWERPSFRPEQLLSVVEHGHRLFVPSRSLFGAMSFALEEVWLRSSDDAVRERARLLLETVRSAFIEYHKERTANFQLPPARAKEDRLNTWVRLEAGIFVMGSEDRNPDERPTRRVRISAFSMQQHEVTNEEYRRFDPAHEFSVGQELHPVAAVSWYEAAGYAAWLGASLPTEAEWEYAAAATSAENGSGRNRQYPWGNEVPTPDRAVFWSAIDAIGQQRVSTLPVTPPRLLGRTPEGIDDMAGNVWEWCRDLYDLYSARNGGETMSDPLGPTVRNIEGSVLRVLRGGSFDYAAGYLRAAFRGRYSPVNRNVNFGFRLVSSRFRP